jgi:DNA-binding transcriptional LysR family regulator
LPLLRAKLSQLQFSSTALGHQLGKSSSSFSRSRFGKVAAESLAAFRRRGYSGYYRILDKLFSPHGVKPRIGVECDSASSLITEVEVGRGIAIVSEVFRELSGDRLIYHRSRSRG